MPDQPCTRCNGEGKLANSDDREPWSYWESLPPGSDLAVQLGLVRPEPCDACEGKGTVPAAEPVVAPVTAPPITVYVSIGNSDDKLTQQEWSHYAGNLVGVMRQHATQIYGEWYSAPDSPYQNACVAAAVPPGSVDQLRAELTTVRTDYGQDSAAWAVAAETDFI